MGHVADYMTPAATLPSDGTAGALAGRVWLPQAERSGGRGRARRRRLRHLRRSRPPCATCARPPTRRPSCAPARASASARSATSSPTRPRTGATRASPGCSPPSTCRRSRPPASPFRCSMLERVIEEQARGSPEKAEAIRKSIAGPARRRSRQAGARQPAGRRAQARADRAGCLVAVPGGRHRPGRRDLHQGAADGGGRARHGRPGCTRSPPGTTPSPRSCWW